MEEKEGTFELSLRVLGNEFVGLRIAVDDFKTKWLFISVVSVATISAIIAEFGEPIKQVFSG